MAHALRKTDRASFRWLLAGIACLLVVFTLDVTQPLGAVVGLLYVIVVVGAFFISARDALILAAIGTAANVLGYVLAPSMPIPEWIVATSRGGSVFATWLLIVTGIHFHKQSQAVIEAISHSNERRRLALEGAELGFWDLDLARGEFVNDPAWVHSLGYGPEDERMNVERLESLVHPDDLPRNQQRWESHLAGRSLRFETEQRFRAADGSWRHLVTRGRVISRDEEGKPLRVSGTHLDVTEAHLLRERAELAQQDRLRELQLLTDALPVRVGFFDAREQLCFGNAAYEDAFGEPLAKLRGRRLCGLAGDDSYERLKPNVAAAMAGEPSQFEHQTVRPEGVRWWLIQLLPREDAEGGAMGFYMLETDITDLKQADIEVDRQRNAIAMFYRQATANEMAAMLAHEINQPLGTIALYAGKLCEMIEAGTAKHEDVGPAMQLMRDEALRAGDVLKRARKMLQDRISEPILLDAGELLAQVARICSTRAAGADVTVIVAAPKAPIEVSADRVQMTQVLVNLVINAIDAAESCPARRRRVELDAQAEDDGVTLRVRDHGPGLLDAQVDGLVAPQRTTKPEGLGIGLAVCRSIVSMHEGRLGATNHRDTPAGGDGVTFSVWLPHAPAEAPQQVNLPLLGESP